MSSPSEDPLFGRLEGIEDFIKMTPTQKAILLEHFAHPELTKTELSKAVGCGYNTVHSLFYSEKFEKLNKELAYQSVRELIHKATRTLAELLNSNQDSIRFATATKILGDAGILKSAEAKTVKQDNRMVIVWGGDKPIQPHRASNGTKVIDVE